MFGSIITGAILTETIFSWRGGKWILDAVNGRNYPVIQTEFFLLVLLWYINLTVDILYSIINQKIKITISFKKLRGK